MNKRRRLYLSLFLFFLLLPLLVLVTSLPDVGSAFASSESAGYAEVSVCALEVKTVGFGFVIVDPSQSQYDCGQKIKLTAVADPGSRFSHWSGDVSGSDPQVTFTLAGAANITANFVKNDPPIFLPAVAGWPNRPYSNTSETEPNNSWNQADGALVDNREYRGRFPNKGDEKDYYFFYQGQEGPVKLRLTGIGSGHNYDLVLRDSNLEEVGYSGELGNSDENISKRLGPGLYYVQVYNRSQTGSSQSYSLVVDYMPPLPPAPTWTPVATITPTPTPSATPIITPTRPGLGSFFDVALLIDSSGSMGSTDPGDKRKEAAKASVDSLDDQDYLAIIDFDSSATVLWSLDRLEGSARTNAKASINQINSSGGTDIGNALQLGYDELNSSSSQRPKFVLFLTDGKGTYNNEAALFAQKGWPVYTVGLSSAADHALLQQIANQTGGRHYAVEDSDRLIEIFSNALNTAIGSTMLLDWTGTLAPNTAPNTYSKNVFSDYHSLTVLLDSALEIDKIGFKILDPRGNTISAADSDVYYAESTYYALFRILNPEEGLWKVELDNKTSSQVTFHLSEYLRTVK